MKPAPLIALLLATAVLCLWWGWKVGYMARAIEQSQTELYRR